ncbi:MAG: lysozyme [Prochlorotrichaceae cyanobacterium]|jgi:GH24 family phage-related lysozyme (muramidase)
MGYSIRSIVDTWLKLRPVQGSTLQNNERTVLQARLELPLAGYRFQGDHILFTFGQDQQGNQIFVGGRNTWYAYAPVMQILRNGQVLSLRGTAVPTQSPTPALSPAPSSVVSTPASVRPESVFIPRGYSLRIKADTWLKTSTAQAASLPPQNRAIVRAGQVLPLAAYRAAGNHIRFTLGKTSQGQQIFVNGRNTWYVYEPAAEILKDGQILGVTALPQVTPTPAPSTAIPQAGIDLIKEFEGYARALPDGRATAYPDPIYGWGVPTIGYGTTRYPDGTPVRQGDIITHQQAEDYLIDHIEESTRPYLERIPTWPRMNMNQRSAIYSFAYNLGARFYAQPGFASITRVCDSPDRWRDYPWVREQFVKYVNPGTSAEVGLRRRREAEARLFVQ